MTDVVEFGGESQAVDSSGSPSMQEYFAEMVEKDVPVRDGDDLISFYEEPEDSEEDQVEDGIDDDTQPLPTIDFTPSANFEETIGKMEESQKGFEQMKDAVLQRGITPEQVQTMEVEFASDGKLSDESFDLLASAGYPKDFITNYIEGQRALSQAYVDGFINSVGGQQSFDNVVATLQSVSPDSLKILEDAVSNRDLTTAKAIISLAGSLQAQSVAQQQAAHIQRYGQPAQRSITTIATPASTTLQPQGYRDKSEMVKAMSDSRYGRDRAYTEEVRSKVALSAW